MGLPAFDTLQYVRELTKAGVPQAQAEAQAELQAKVLSELVTDKLATKDDLFKLEITLDKKLDEKISSLEKKLDEKVSPLKARLSKVESKLAIVHWMLGFVLAGTTSLILKAFF